MGKQMGTVLPRRRQITKRPFHFGSPNVSTTKKVTPDAKAKTTKEEEKTPSLIHDSTSIGDVSVSFLASTPKPGKQQLSRRRPLSAVHEAKVSKTDVLREDSRSNNENSSRLKKGERSRSQLKDNTRSQEENKSKANDSEFCPQTKDEFSTSERRFSRNPQQLSRSQNISKQIPSSQGKSICNPDADSITNIKQSKVRASNLSPKTESKSAIKNKGKPASNSVNRKITASFNTNSVLKERSMPNYMNRFEASAANINNSNKRKRAPEISDTSREVDLAEKIVDKRRKVSQAVEPISINKPVEFKQTALNKRSKIKSQNQIQVSRTEETSPLIRDSSLKDISIRNKEDRNGKRKKPTQAGTRQGEKQESDERDREEEHIPVQVMRLHKSDVVRKKNDMMDLDVVLSTLTETLELEIDECETQVEKSAIKLVQKYLVQDMSTMIDNVLNVKKLQDKNKKGRKTLKERQKTLMTLQQRKSKLQIGKQSIEDDRQSAVNMKEINTFLCDMKDLLTDL